MTNVKHTPGPWEWGEHHPQNACATVYGIAEWGQYEIAQLYSAPTDVAELDANCVWGDHPERRANARLMAAAPDLLEALKEAADPVAGYLHGPVLDRALAAIAKAEGRDR